MTKYEYPEGKSFQDFGCRTEDCDCTRIDNCRHVEEFIVPLEDQCTDRCQYKAINTLAMDVFENVEVKQSRIAYPEMGLFAKRSFQALEPIMIYAGEVLTDEEKYQRAEQLLQKGFTTNYMAQFSSLSAFGKPIYVDCSHAGNMAGMANSCNANNNAVLNQVCHSTE